MKRLFFDTEFLEDGRTVELLSIGIVDDAGRAYYAVSADCDVTRANDWVKAHVLPLLQTPPGPVIPRARIRDDLLRFCGDGSVESGGPLEFWTYNGQWDWVVLAQIFGPMTQFPPQWPTFCMDVKQWRAQLAVDGKRPPLPKQSTPAHHALNDALWVREVWAHLDAVARERA